MSAVELIKIAFEAVNEEGGRALVRRYDEFFTDDFEFIPAMTGSLDGRVYRGRDGFAEYWDDLYDSFAEMSFPEASFEAVSETVVLVLARMKLVGHESGVSLEQDVSFLFELREGKVVRGRTFLTQAEGRKAAYAAA